MEGNISSVSFMSHSDSNLLGTYACGCHGFFKTGLFFLGEFILFKVLPKASGAWQDTWQRRGINRKVTSKFGSGL